MRSAVVIAFIIAGTAGFLVSPKSLNAQSAPQGRAAQAWEDGWKAGVEEVQESISGEAMVIAAYSVLWLIVFVFVLRLAVKLRTARRDLEELKRRVSELDGKGN